MELVITGSNNKVSVSDAVFGRDFSEDLVHRSSLPTATPVAPTMRRMSVRAFPLERELAAPAPMRNPLDQRLLRNGPPWGKRCIEDPARQSG